MLMKATFNSPFSVAREMDRLFDTMMAAQPLAAALPTFRERWAFPALNVWEDADKYIAEAELPGLSMNDIDVLVTEDQLTVKGTRNVSVPEEAQPLRRERAVGSFERTITLPAAIDTDHVEARFNNGVLTINLPKVPEARPRKIEVKALPHN